MDVEQEQEQEQEEAPETSLREDMEAAMSEVADNEEESTGDEYVEEAPKVEEEEAKKLENGDTTPTADEPAAAADKPGADEVKAPQSWSPKLREDFAKLPANVQGQITKREQEISTFLNDGAESRKFGDKVNQALQPYQAVMTAHGTNDPVQAIQGLMETAGLLQLGTPQQKAQKLAEMVEHYGVDINMLDGALSGQPQSSPEQTQLEQLLEQKLAPMNQFMNTVQQNQNQSQQQVQQNAQTEVSTFEQKAEFINDVRNDMADLLDMAASRNQDMTLQQAYDKACALNPEISGIVAQRASDERIKSAAAKTSNKRYAASSIRATQSGVPQRQPTNSLMGDIQQAWDDVENN